jgi:hypothetical protein
MELLWEAAVVVAAAVAVVVAGDWEEGVAVSLLEEALGSKGVGVLSVRFSK